MIAAEDPQLVLIGHMVDGLEVGPALAARGRLGFASDVIAAIAWDEGPVAVAGSPMAASFERARVPGPSVHAA